MSTEITIANAGRLRNCANIVVNVPLESLHECV
jgi:hypothetical protein